MKHVIQKALVARIGIRYDYIKQGKGTSTNGNAATRFFEEAETSADILGIDVNIIKGFVHFHMLTSKNLGFRLQKKQLLQYCIQNFI